MLLFFLLSSFSSFFLISYNTKKFFIAKATRERAAYALKNAIRENDALIFESVPTIIATVENDLPVYTCTYMKTGKAHKQRVDEPTG